MRELAELVAERVEVADVLETSVGGYTGGLRVAVVVRGDFLLGVDLSRAKVQAVDAEAKSFELVLPPPQASSPRVDHSRTHLFEVFDHGLWAVVPGDAGRSRVVERAFEEAQRVVEEASADPALAERSKRRAEQVLKGFFESTGWKAQVKWDE